MDREWWGRDGEWGICHRRTESNRTEPHSTEVNRGKPKPDRAERQHLYDDGGDGGDDDQNHEPDHTASAYTVYEGSAWFDSDL